MSDHVLVGDVGGTNSRFALAAEGDGISLAEVRSYENDNFDGFHTVLKTYLSDISHNPRQALFALAGPPDKSGAIKLVNRDWPIIRSEDLEATTALEEVWLVNDFKAMSRAIPELKPSAFSTIRQGAPDPDAPIIVTGPGTGFGVGTLVPMDNGTYHIVSGEGGHAAYSARTIREAQLMDRLISEFGYISTEMIVSGAWLQTVFDHISDMHGRDRAILSPLEVLQRAENGDAVCEEVCQLRANAIMGAAGDLVLINGGLGGVVLTGSVAQGMTQWLTSSAALDRFENRGSHTDYISQVPVSVLHDASAPLIGAAALLFGDQRDDTQ
ncbi:MAG: glucokinase [Pseudomonadota bacterium]